MTKVLEVIDLHKSFGGINAVAGCDFSVERGTIVALIGPNGAGKTTVFNLISGLLSPDKGKILLKGENVTDICTDKRARMGIARTFQLTRLFPKMTVMENMLLAMKHTSESLLDVLLRGKKTKELEKNNENRAQELLESVNLHIKANELASNLSYGQQKLLEIARALAQEPEVIMLDEPVAGVNPTMLKNIRNLLLKLKKEGKTIVFIEHNMEFVMNLADKVVVLDYGDEIATGTPKSIQKNKRVIDAYLGVTSHKD